MRCGRGSKYMKMQGTVQGPNISQRIWKNGESNKWEDTIWQEEWTGREKC